MVVFVAKKLSVDTSDLKELVPPHQVPGHTIGFKAKAKNGKVTKITVTEDGQVKYTLTKLKVKKNKIDSYFQGDFEAKLFKGNDKITGSTEHDHLYGYNGRDKIYGRDGMDHIFGDSGNDKLYGGNHTDLIYGGIGNDKLYGGNDADLLYGGPGNDLLNGGAGANNLWGEAGKDKYLFDVQLKVGNNSHIVDFQVGTDKVVLDKSVFKGIGKKGKMKAAKFVKESDYTGQKNVVIYDKDLSGGLSYAKSNGDIIAFGSVNPGLELSHKDFLIVP